MEQPELDEKIGQTLQKRTELLERRQRLFFVSAIVLLSVLISKLHRKISRCVQSPLWTLAV